VAPDPTRERDEIGQEVNGARLESRYGESFSAPRSRNRCDVKYTVYRVKAEHSSGGDERGEKQAAAGGGSDMGARFKFECCGI